MPECSRLVPHIHRPDDGVGGCTDHRDGVAALVRHVSEGAGRIDGNSEGSAPHIHRRGDEVGGCIDHRDVVAAAIGDVSELCARAARKGQRQPGYREERPESWFHPVSLVLPVAPVPDRQKRLSTNAQSLKSTTHRIREQDTLSPGISILASRLSVAYSNRLDSGQVFGSASPEAPPSVGAPLPAGAVVGQLEKAEGLSRTDLGVRDFGGLRVRTAKWMTSGCAAIQALFASLSAKSGR